MGERVVVRLWSGQEAGCRFKNGGVTTNGEGQRGTEERPDKHAESADAPRMRRMCNTLSLLQFTTQIKI